MSEPRTPKTPDQEPTPIAPNGVPGDDAPERPDRAPAVVNSEVVEFTSVFRSVFEPIADAEIAKAEETTKQVKLWTDLVRTRYRGLFTLVVLVFAFAVIAYLRGDLEASHILTAFLGFAAGFGIGHHQATEE